MYDIKKDIEINGIKGLLVAKDSVQRIILTDDDLIMYISCNDPDVDIVGFADLIEKR